MKRFCLSAAVLLLAFFMGCSVLGYAECTSVLSGTPPANGMSMGNAALRAIAYVLSYFAMVVFVVPLLVTAGVLHWRDRREFAKNHPRNH